MQITEIQYDTDGRTMTGTFAVDELRSTPRPAVLVCHEGPGLDDHARGRAIRLAGLGYAAFALDYHGGAVPLDDAMARLGELMANPDRTQAIARAGLDVLLAQDGVARDRVAAIGYCFGGTMAIELARSGADLAAVTAFHAGLGATRRAGKGDIKAAMLLCIGSDDPIVSTDDRLAFEQEMRDAEVAEWRVDLYGGVGHSFTNPLVDQLGMPGFAFDATADRRSWRAMLELFDDRLGPTD